MLDDLRHGLRVLLATPVHAAVALLALSLAIGANTALFSVTHAVLLRPLPFTDPDRLVALWEQHPLLGKQEVAPPDYDDWRAETRSFAAFGAFTMPGHVKLAMSGAGLEPEQIQGTLASHTLFPMLGVSPILGRTFLSSEDAAGHDDVAILSHGLWQRRFGGDANVVGRSILLNGERIRIIGVLPARIQVPDWADLCCRCRAWSRWRSSSGSGIACRCWRG